METIIETSAVLLDELAPASYEDYESCLSRFTHHFCDLDLADFEPPVGTERVEEFLDSMWGKARPATYHKALAIVLLPFALRHEQTR